MADHAERQIPTAAKAGIQLCVAVVDIVHDSHHDISRGAASFWFPQFIGGRVGAFGAALSCETWSVARWIEYAQALLERSQLAEEELHNRKHPVPLRTAAQPWGRSDLTPKEHRHVRTANVLLTYTIAFASLAFFCGIGAWVEHPGLLSKHQLLGAPSTLKLEPIQRLAQPPHCRRRQVLFSDFGGDSMKPTGLLLLHLDQFEVHEISHACKVHPTRQLKGKDEVTGAWNTSAAKEYPPLLSAALARAMVDDACRHPIQHKNIPHPAFCFPIFVSIPASARPLH